MLLFMVIYPQYGHYMHTYVQICASYITKWEKQPLIRWFRSAFVPAISFVLYCLQSGWTPLIVEWYWPGILLILLLTLQSVQLVFHVFHTLSVDPLCSVMYTLLRHGKGHELMKRLFRSHTSSFTYSSTKNIAFLALHEM